MYVFQDGKYAGFDDQEFTSRSGGKYKAIMHIKVSIYFVISCMSIAIKSNTT